MAAQADLDGSGSPVGHADEVDRLTRQLRDEIQDLDVGPVELVRGGSAPPGARSVRRLPRAS